MSKFALALLLFAVADARATCLPIQGKIFFSGVSNHLDLANLMGGDIPLVDRPIGSVSISASALESTPPEPRACADRYAEDPDAELALTVGRIFPAGGKPYPAYPDGAANKSGPFGQPMLANLGGYLLLKPAAFDRLKEEIQSEAIRLPEEIDPDDPDLAKICVSEVAINLGLSPSGTIQGGSIYLYLNDTLEDFEVWF